MNDIVRLSRDDSQINQLRARISVILLAIAYYSLWPALLLRFIVQRQAAPDLANPLASSARGALFLPDLVFATCLAFALFCSVFVWPLTVQHAPYLGAFLAIPLLHISSRHLSYLIRIEPIKQGLRQSLGSPYIRFLLIAFADLIALCCIYSSFLYSSQAIPVSLANLIEIGKKLVGPQELVQQFSGGALLSRETVIAMSGLLYVTTLAKAIWLVNDFQRQDQDYLAIAWRYLALNRYADAKKWLDRVKTPDNATRFAVSIAHLGIGEINEAVKAMTLYGWSQRCARRQQLCLLQSLRFFADLWALRAGV